MPESEININTMKRTCVPSTTRCWHSNGGLLKTPMDVDSPTGTVALRKASKIPHGVRSHLVVETRRELKQPERGRRLRGGTSKITMGTIIACPSMIYDCPTKRRGKGSPRRVSPLHLRGDASTTAFQTTVVAYGNL